MKNTITKEVAAGLVFHTDSLFVDTEYKNSMIILAISMIIIAVGLLLLYKELKYKMDLQQTVNDRTEELLRLNKQLDEMAHTDKLTGAYNRRYFYEVVEEIIALSKRELKNLSMAMIDIDKFKDVNDTYGHDKGDEVLQALVDEVTAQIRSSDVFVRFGGEEFILLFLSTNLEQALVISEKIRLKVEACQRVRDVSFTISIGVCEFIRAEDDINSFVKKADIALYEAKNSGRNRVSYIQT